MSHFSLRMLAALAAMEVFLGAVPLVGQRYEPDWIDMTPADKKAVKEWVPAPGQRMKLWGGLAVHPGFKSVFAGPAGKGAVVDLFLKVSNDATSTVWLEAEIDVPGEEKESVKSMEVKPDHWRSETWKVKDLQWGTAYLVKISAFSDKKKSSSLGTMTASLTFDEADKATLEQAKTRESEALRETDRFTFVSLSGWGKLSDEELAAVKKKEEVKAEAKAKFDQMLSDKTPPPFEWNESAGSPGVTLTATETNRMAGPRGPVAMFAMSANGFGADEDLTFWTKWLDGKYMRMSGVSLSEKGVMQSVLAGKAAPMGVAVGTMAPGEPISWALASSSGKVAYARAVVYPIESRSGGGCSVSAELASPSGLLFHVSFRGFKPGEELTLSNEFKNESASSPGHADDKGGLDFPVEFSENDHGKAGVSAVGKDCKVSVGYKVGPEALAKR